MTRGLPPLDLPRHLAEPKSCRRCKWFDDVQPKTGPSRHVCRLSGISCTYERHEAGQCGPDAKLWEERL